MSDAAMYATQMFRAAVSAGVFAGVGYAMTQGNIAMEALLFEAGIQGGSALVSDIIHLQTNLLPSDLTSAGITGALCAGAKFALRKDPNLAVNFGISAGVDYGTNQIISMAGMTDYSGNAE